MKPADPLDGLLPPPPPGRGLPRHERHRRELLAIVGSERAAGRRWPAAPWLAPLGAAVAVLVLVAGMFLLPGVFGGPRHGGGAAPAVPGPSAAGGGGHATLLRRTETSLVSAAVKRLVVRGAVGDVHVTGTDRSTVSITAHLTYRGSAPMISRQLTGAVLKLGYTCPSGSRHCGVSFDLAVPRGVGVMVRVGVGDIRIGGLSGTIAISTDIGQIQASGLSGQRVRLTTGTGMISAGFTAPPELVYGHAGTGSVAIRVPPGTAYQVTARTQVGSVRIAVPQAASSSHVIQATTGVGAVTVTGS